MYLHLASNPRVECAPAVTRELAPLDAALLAWLALEGPTPRARLAALLWPDKDAEAARNSLRQRLFQLRRSVGVELVQGSTTLALAEGAVHDLDDADSVLGEIAGEDLAPGEFAQWLGRQRARRIERVRHALVELAEMAEGAKDWDDALTHARELLALEPLSEDAHRRVMRLHYLAGDRAAALLAFDRCEQMLKDEVGARPSAQTLALLATVGAARVPQAAAVLPAHRRVPAAVLRPPRLVGRDAPWRALHEAWDEGRVACVLGDAGMGKTRLLGDFALARGATLLVGSRPGDVRGVHAFVSRLLRQWPRAALEAQPSGVREELAHLLPELGPRPDDGPGFDRTRFLNAVAALLEDAGSGIDAVACDDLHFADSASLELLSFVSQRSRLHWIFAARGSELSTEAQALFAAQRDDAVSIALLPLGVEQTAELLASLELPGLDAAQAAPALHKRAGGNPLFLLETLKAWVLQGGTDPAGAARLPALQGVAALIERRIGQLSQPAVQLARCAAIAAPYFSIELAAHLLGRRTIDRADPWSELEAANVLLDDGVFAHDLIHEAALAAVPQPIALQLHADIARWLAIQGAPALALAHHA